MPLLYFQFSILPILSVLIDYMNLNLKACPLYDNRSTGPSMGNTSRLFPRFNGTATGSRPRAVPG